MSRQSTPRAEVAAANVRCTSRVQATSAKLAAAAANYTENEANSAALLRTLDAPKPELITIDLTDDERDFMQTALTEFGGTASYSPFPIAILGVSTDDEFDELLDRLRKAIARREMLSYLDWARAQLLVEMCWASDMIGSGTEFTYSYRDELAAPLMRAIQRKLRRYPLGYALFPDNGGRRTYAETQALRNKR